LLSRENWNAFTKKIKIPFCFATIEKKDEERQTRKQNLWLEVKEIKTKTIQTKKTFKLRLKNTKE
jgi:hypothetical protein